MVKRAEVKSLFARENPLCAEHHRHNALVLGRVEAGRTQALRLAERHRLPVERIGELYFLHFADV
jgi:hypothetical protein